MTSIAFVWRLPICAKKVISKGFAKALPEGVDATPTPYFVDNPVWAQDEATVAYIKICQGTKAGDPLNPFYAERIGTASLISDGISEYDDERYREALAFCRPCACREATSCASTMVFTCPTGSSAGATTRPSHSGTWCPTV